VTFSLPFPSLLVFDPASRVSLTGSARLDEWLYGLSAGCPQIHSGKRRYALSGTQALQPALCDPVVGINRQDVLQADAALCV
jgi:hypothetical protein